MAGGPIWQDGEEKFLAECVARDLSVEETIAAFNLRFDKRSDSAIARRRTNHRVQEHADNLRSQGIYRGTPLPGPDGEIPEDDGDGPVLITEAKHDRQDAATLWKQSEVLTSKAVEHHKKRHKATLVFQETKPIAMCFISDQHISTSGPVNLRRMKRDAELVAETPGMYAMLGGDGVDNHVKHRTAMIANKSRPSDEYQLYDHYLGLFRGSIAAMVSGNHDDWTKDFADVDMVGVLAKRHRVFYAPDYVIMDVQLPGQNYIVKVRHQYRYESSFNHGHAIKRLWDMGGHEFDIGVLCHKHESHTEPFYKHGVQRWALRPGSYQFLTGYSRRYGYGDGGTLPRCPTVIIFPHKRIMLGFPDVRPAAGYMRYLWTMWPESGDLFLTDPDEPA